MLHSKIHRATVTQADLDYVGSITIDADLVNAAGLIEGEKVAVVNVTNGARLETYVITGHAGTGDICINGAAAHLIHKGDVAIVISYSMLDEVECRTYSPHVVFVDENNRAIDVSAEPGQVPEGASVQSSGMTFAEYRAH